MPSINRIILYSKKYAPEILTGVGVGSHVASNILFVRAEKLYLQDGKKSHFLLPCGLSILSIVSVIGSNRLSSKEKGVLLAGSSALAAKYLKDRKTIKEKYGQDALTDADLAALMEKADKANEEPFDEDKDCIEDLIYLPDYGVMFWSDISDVMKAELNLNECFVHSGEAYLSDFFTFLKFKKDDNPALFDLAEAYGWRYNYDDYDDGMQYIAFNNFEKIINYKGRDVVCHFVYFNEEALPMHEWGRIYGDCEE